MYKVFFPKDSFSEQYILKGNMRKIAYLLTALLNNSLPVASFLHTHFLVLECQSINIDFYFCPYMKIIKAKI